jgi:hypothetical protein
MECFTSCLPSRYVIPFAPIISVKTSAASLIEYPLIPPTFMIYLLAWGLIAAFHNGSKLSSI